jgi:hypothetical protein
MWEEVPNQVGDHKAEHWIPDVYQSSAESGVSSLSQREMIIDPLFVVGARIVGRVLEGTLGPPGQTSMRENLGQQATVPYARKRGQPAARKATLREVRERRRRVRRHVGK